MKLSEGTFFTSEHWWQASESAWPQTQAYQNSTLVRVDDHAYARLGRAKVSRQGKLINARRLGFNQLVNETYDEITIEHNGFFGTNGGNFAQHLPELFNQLNRDSQWDEILFSRLHEQDYNSLIKFVTQTGLAFYVEDLRPAYFADLRLVREQFKGDYLASLSSNTRQQVRRSSRDTEKALGAIQLERALNIEQAQHALNELGVFHRARWHEKDSDTTLGKGFNNPNFVIFHQTLINQTFESGAVDLLTIKAGGSTLAVLYNFIWNGTVYFYMSGVNHELNSKFRPGIVAHVTAIEHYLSNNSLERYDFLAGQNRYKQSLSHTQYNMVSVVVQRPKLLLTLERKLRVLKRKFKAKRQVNEPIAD
jgi:Acetyltransferase (GNAT) domain